MQLSAGESKKELVRVSLTKYIIKARRTLAFFPQNPCETDFKIRIYLAAHDIEKHRTLTAAE